MQAENKPVLIEMTTVSSTAWAFFRGRLRFFREAGFEVYLISSGVGLLEKVGEREGVEVISFPMIRRIEPLKDLLSVWKLFLVFRRLRPAIVNSHTPKAGLLGMIAAALARVPVRFYTIHGLQLEATGTRKWILRLSELISSRLAHLTVCVSRSIAEIAVEKKISRPDRIKVLANGSINGMDTDRFDPEKFKGDARENIRKQYDISESAVVAGYIGRIVRDKGMKELAEAWLALRDEFPELHLLIIGPFEDEDPVPDEVKSLFHQDPRIHLTGFVEDVAPCYSAIDIVVLPTYREGFPYVPLEAQAMGIPVITTAVPGAVDSVIDGVTGIIVPAKDHVVLAAALRRLINDPGLSREMGKAGRERVIRDFQPDIIWKALYEEYIGLMESRGIQVGSAGEI